MIIKVNSKNPGRCLAKSNLSQTKICTNLSNDRRWQKGKLAQGDRRIEIAQDVVNF